MKEEKENIKIKEGLFTTLCVGVSAIAAAPRAGTTIREIYDKITR